MNLIFPLDKGWTIFCESFNDKIFIDNFIIKLLNSNSKDKINVIECSDILKNDSQRIEFFEQIYELSGKEFSYGFVWSEIPIFFKDGVYIGHFGALCYYISNVQKQIELK